MIYNYLQTFSLGFNEKYCMHKYDTEGVKSKNTFSLSTFIKYTLILAHLVVEHVDYLKFQKYLFSILQPLNNI